MAPLTRRRFPYEEGGCAWQVPQCDQISTTAEAETEARYWVAAARHWAAEDKAENYDTCICTWLDWCTCGTAKNTELEEPAEH